MTTQEQRVERYSVETFTRVDKGKLEIGKQYLAFNEEQKTPIEMVKKHTLVFVGILPTNKLLFYPLENKSNLVLTFDSACIATKKEFVRTWKRATAEDIGKQVAYNNECTDNISEMDKHITKELIAVIRGQYIITSDNGRLLGYRNAWVQVTTEAPKPFDELEDEDIEDEDDVIGVYN